MIAERLAYESLTSEERAQLRELYTGHPQGDTLIALASRVGSRETSLVRLTGVSCQVVLELRVAEYPKGKELQVAAIIGRGLLENLDEIVWWCNQVGKASGCRWTSMTTHRKGWERFMRRFGKPILTVWRLEL